MTTDLDTIKPRRGPPKHKHEPRKRLNPRVKAACELLAEGECVTITEAANRAGISREWLSKSLNSAVGRSFVNARARSALQTGVLRASQRVVDLVESGNDRTALDAANLVLRIEGISPPDRPGTQVNIGISPGYVIRLRHLEDDKVIEGEPMISQQKPTMTKPLKGMG